VAYSAWRLVGETVNVLMQAAPPHIDVDEVRAALSGVVGVIAVHDLHVWTITSGTESLSGHVVVARDGPHTRLLECARQVLHDRFGIEHVTLQIEPPGFGERGSC